MGRAKEYRPLVPEIRENPRLSPAMNPNALGSFDRGIRAYVDRDHTAGQEWSGLVRALGSWSKELEEYGMRNTQIDAQKDWTTMEEIMAKQDNIGKQFVQLTQENPDLIGASPVFRNAYTSVAAKNKLSQLYTDMNTARIEQGWDNDPDPSSVMKKAHAFEAQWRQQNLGDLQEEAGLQVFNEIFTGGTQKLKEGVLQKHAEAQVQNRADRGMNVFKGNIYNAIKNNYNDPVALAKTFAKHQAIAVGSGVNPEIARNHLIDSVFEYLESEGVDVNDYRAENMLSVLDLLTDDTGRPLSHDVSILARKEKLEEGRESKRYAKEVREVQARKLKQEKEKLDNMENIFSAVKANPNVSDEELAAAIGKTTLTANDHETKADALRILNASYVQVESPTQRANEIYLQMDLVSGKANIHDIISANRRGDITDSQAKGLFAHAPKDATQLNKIREIAEDAGAKNALKAIDAAFPINDNTDPVTQFFNKTVASQLFDMEVQRAIQDRLSKGLSIEDIAGVINTAMAKYADPNNPDVINTAKAMKEKTFGQGDMELLKKQVTTQAPSWAMQPVRGVPQYKHPDMKNLTPEVRSTLGNAGARFNLPSQGMYAVSLVESAFNPDAKNPKSSAKGLMQLIDGTAKWLGVDSTNMYENAFGGAKYLDHIFKVKGLDRNNPEDWGKAYWFYHEGHGAKEENIPDEVKRIGNRIVATMRTLMEEDGAYQQENQAKTVADFSKQLATKLPDLVKGQKVLKTLMRTDEEHLDSVIQQTFGAEALKEFTTWGMGPEDIQHALKDHLKKLEVERTKWKQEGRDLLKQVHQGTNNRWPTTEENIDTN